MSAATGSVSARKQNNDQRDADHVLKLLRKTGFPGYGCRSQQ